MMMHAFRTYIIIIIIINNIRIEVFVNKNNNA